MSTELCCQYVVAICLTAQQRCLGLQHTRPGLLMCAQCTQSCLKGPACYHCTRVQPSVRWSLRQLLITLYWATEETALNDNSVMGNNQTLCLFLFLPLWDSIILAPFRTNALYPELSRLSLWIKMKQMHSKPGSLFKWWLDFSSLLTSVFSQETETTAKPNHWHVHGSDALYSFPFLIMILILTLDFFQIQSNTKH